MVVFSTSLGYLPFFPTFVTEKDIHFIFLQEFAGPLSFHLTNTGRFILHVIFAGDIPIIAMVLIFSVDLSSDLCNIVQRFVIDT